jgi:hypothetical protein
MRSPFLAPIVLLVMVLLATPATAETLIRARFESPDARVLADAWLDAGLDVLEPTITDTALEVILSAETLADLAGQGYVPVSTISGRPFVEIQAERQGAGLEPESVPPGYLDLAAIIAEMQDTAAAYPSICQFVDLTAKYGLAPTYEGRHMYALKISDNVGLEEDEPAFALVACHHAREINAPVVALHALEQFTTLYGSDPQITSLVNEYEIWIAPVWNPDGYEYCYYFDNYWRKNRHPFTGGTGVDQNRNYPQGWYGECSGSTVVSSETYKGPGPASEAETQTMMAWARDQRFDKLIDYHSYGRETLHGYACWSHPFDSYYINRATALTTASGYSGIREPSGEGEDQMWHFATFSSSAYLIEIGLEFQPSYSSAQTEAAQVFSGVLWMLQDPIPLCGNVTDAMTGEPVAATITMVGVPFQHDETNSSGGAFGRYHIFAPAGNYTLLFQAAGYYDETIEVGITGSPTVRNVTMLPESYDRGLQGTVSNATAGGTPVPNATITVIGTATTMETGADGTYSGYVIAGDFRVAVTHPSFAPDTSEVVSIVVGETTTVDFSLVDIAGPSVTNTTEYPSTDDTVGPYEIESTITDMSALAGTVLYYRIPGQSFVAVPMSALGGDVFQGDIPGQPLHTTVQYYVYASDEGGNITTDPPGAPGELYVFYVAPFVTAYEDHMETGQGDWQHYAVTSGYSDQWHMSTQRNHTAGGTTSWKCGATGTGNYANLLDAALESPEWSVGMAASVTFWHWIDAEDSGTYPGTGYDGGFVEISADGGAWEEIIPVGGYSHIVRAGAQSPFPPGMPFFSGTHDWEEVALDLSDYEGSDARLRFRFGSDGNTGGEGWYIDDVVVTQLGALMDVAQNDTGTPMGRLVCRRLDCAPSPVVGREGVQIHFQLSRPAEVQLRIYDAAGRMITSLAAPQALVEGGLHWNGRDAAGRPVGSGLYLMRLSSGAQRLGDHKVMMLRE